MAGRAARRAGTTSIPTTTGPERDRLGKLCPRPKRDHDLLMRAQRQLARVARGGTCCLRIVRGSKGILCPREGDEEGITLRVDLDATVACERRAQHATMLGERIGICITQLLQESHGPLDVRKEKGYGTCRQLRHPRLHLRA